jgi:pilus assembly protein CpaF
MFWRGKNADQEAETNSLPRGGDESVKEICDLKGLKESGEPPRQEKRHTAEGQVVVSWRDGKKSERMAFGQGRHLIGSSSFAAIRLGDSGHDICAALSVTLTETRLKCIGPSPTLFVEGTKLKPGDSILVGDILEVTIGRYPLTISAGSLAETPAHMQTPDELKNRRARKNAEESDVDPLQAAANGAFANPDKLRQVLSKKLLDQLNLDQMTLAQLDSPRVRETARLKLKKMVTELSFPDRYEFTGEEIEQQVFDEVMGLGPLEPLLADAAVTEIMVNRRDQIYIERQGKLALSRVYFSSDQALLNVIERIVSKVGRRIDASSPIVDARLLDGSRVNAVIPPLALKGPCLTIRRFSKTPITVDQLVGWNSISQHMADFLRFMVHEHKNMLISGGTGSGKTTLLNALSSFIPATERIVTVEDAAELQLQQPHIISLETRPANLEGNGAVTIRDLVKNTLRMRPDRIIVGECRGAEALDMLQAMNTGHDGSMTTAHANTPEDMLRRLETMVLMAGMDLPLRAIREQIASALTIIVQQCRRKDGRRLVTDISWIKGLNRSSGEYIVVPLFQRDMQGEVSVNTEAFPALWKEEEIAGDYQGFIPNDCKVMRMESQDGWEARQVDKAAKAKIVKVDKASKRHTSQTNIK